MNKRKNLLISLLLIFTALLCSCSINDVTITPEPEPSITQTAEPVSNTEATAENIITFTDIPDYSDSPCIEADENEPYFVSSDYEDASFEEYSEPDELGYSEEVVNYIRNKNSMKFHEPDCRSVGQMKESNKVSLSCTRSEAIDKGYKPCKHCNP